MRVPKPKHKQTKSMRLKHIDGVRDVEIGPASVEAREQGNFHVTGKGVNSLRSQMEGESMYEDESARRRRLGLYF